MGTSLAADIPERAAMKRLKERVYKIYKLDYGTLKAIMEAQNPDAIPFEAEIHNRHELIRKLDKIVTAPEVAVEGMSARIKP